MKIDIKNKVVNLSPPSLLALGFLSFIGLGTFLLSLPVSQQQKISFIDALFTATSAVTITGLSVVNVGETFSIFGQLIILALIQFGGLGFMTFAILAALSLSPKLGLKQRMLVQDTIGQTSLSNVTSVIYSVLFYSFFFEAIGFSLLAVQWIPKFGFVEGSYYALFYSISAFNNAGFSLFSDSLISFQSDFGICLTISCLYIIGGIGFIVLMDIKTTKKWQKLATNSKLILSTIFTLNIIAFLLIWLFESSNPLTLQPLTFWEQGVNAWFQATVPRSSGFNSIDTASMTNASTFMTMLLMFIGGGSLSTAGGIKVGTFVILILSVNAFLRRDDEVRAFMRTIPQIIVLKALAVALITSMLIFIGIILIAISQPNSNSIDLMFEVVSATCTVGLSRGITSALNDYSLVILSMLMFLGRLGPLTLAYLIATPRKSRLKYVDSHIQVG